MTKTKYSSIVNHQILLTQAKRGKKAINPEQQNLKAKSSTNQITKYRRLKTNITQFFNIFPVHKVHTIYQGRFPFIYIFFACKKKLKIKS